MTDGGLGRHLYIAEQLGIIRRLLDDFVKDKDVSITEFDYYDGILSVVLTRKWAKYAKGFDTLTILKNGPENIAYYIIQNAKQHLRIQEEK